MKKIVTLLILFVLILSCIYSQDKTILSDSFPEVYKIKKIKGWSNFEKLTPLEEGWHRLIQEGHEDTDRLYKLDRLYLPTVSEEKKRLNYEYELKLRNNFNENRSRYFIEEIKNEKIMAPNYIDDSPLSTECLCKVKEDIISISMGIWVFGGFAFEIKIINKKYIATYIEDAHEDQPFKYTPNDSSFVDHIKLPIINSELIIDDPIEFKVGETLNGLFKFETPLYYTDPYYHYHLEYSNKRLLELDEMKTKGKIFFTCILKEPIVPPKE